MFPTDKILLVVLTLVTALVWSASDATAQCRSPSGGVARGTPVLMYPPIVRLASYGMMPQCYPGAQALAMQRQTYQQAQQQVLSMRRPPANRYQSAIDENVLALRRERAEETRRAHRASEGESRGGAIWETAG